MSHEVFYNGVDIDIEKTFDGLTITSINDGRLQEIYLENLSDMEILYNILDGILNKSYAESQTRQPLDYVELDGC